jgi:hypothetical protein
LIFPWPGCGRKSNLLKKILPFFSYLFHPLFIPVFAVLSYLFLSENYLVPAEKFLVIIQIVIITVLIPIAFFFLLRSMGKMDTIMASDLRQRKLPLILQAILIIILIRQSFLMDRVPVLHFFFIGALLSIILALMLLFCKIKASLHMLGMASLVFFMIALSYFTQHNSIPYIAFLFIMTGVVATSRLHMQAHTNKELAIGFLCGMFSQMAFWYFWL